MNKAKFVAALTSLVSLIQAGGCDLVHGFDAVHMAITSNPDF